MKKLKKKQFVSVFISSSFLITFSTSDKVEEEYKLIILEDHL
ncbi:hypothetical protein P9858_16040 [Niallia circulans]|nr:hypothetical protein [Niallia circulans]